MLIANALLRQNYPADRLHIVVVDDDSDDGTSIVARAVLQAE